MDFAGRQRLKYLGGGLFSSQSGLAGRGENFVTDV